MYKNNDMRLKPKYIIVFVLMLASSAMYAQADLKINSIFEKYGKQKGAVMVVLSGKSKELKNYGLNQYRSLTINYDKAIFNDIQNCLETDKKNATKIKEVVANGVISSGYYQLRDDNTQLIRYILFKVDDNHKATLIYMVGDEDSEETIDNMFLKRK